MEWEDSYEARRYESVWIYPGTDPHVVFQNTDLRNQSIPSSFSQESAAFDLELVGDNPAISKIIRNRQLFKILSVSGFGINQAPKFYPRLIDEV